MNRNARAVWPVVQFGQIARKLVNGGTPPTEVARFWNGDIPWVTGADFTPAGIGEFRRFVTTEATRQTATNVIDKGQLLLVTRTGVGKLAIASCDIAISQDITGVYVDESQVWPAFLLHRMRRGVEDLKKLNQGTSINGIVRSDLVSYAVELPPLPQQRRIAEILSTLDVVIEHTESLIAKYQQIKSGLMHDLFTRGVLPDGKLRPTREEAPELYKESVLGWVPREWEVRTLSEFTQYDITYGIVQAGPNVENGVPYIRTGDMAGDALARDGLLCTSKAIANSYQRSEVRRGEIVCAIRATVGKVLLVPSELDGANLTQGTARIAPRKDVDSSFLLWAIRAERTQKEIAAVIKGTTFSEITLANLRRLPLAAPKGIDEQVAIRKCLDKCVNTVRSEYLHLTKLRHQKSGLMRDLLTGRVQVNVPESNHSGDTPK